MASSYLHGKFDGFSIWLRQRLRFFNEMVLYPAVFGNSAGTGKGSFRRPDMDCFVPNVCERGRRGCRILSMTLNATAPCFGKNQLTAREKLYQLFNFIQNLAEDIQGLLDGTGRFQIHSGNFQQLNRRQ